MHFFTDIDLLQVQTVSQSFGEKGTSNGNDIFQVTSKHTASASPKAYAVCKGKILVQPDETNAALVNIILKPEQQSAVCPPILYYIYRGVLKNSLVNGNVVIPDTDSQANTLTKSINEAVENPSTDILGLGLYNKTNFDNSDRIENAFYFPRNEFELWTVGAGWCIGTFDSVNMGFEIMQDVLGFQPTFELVRKNVSQIEVSSLTGSETSAKVFEHWHDKEEILNYIDPAAFYGNFYNEKMYARASTGAIDNDSLMPKFDKKKGDAIYLDVLCGTSGSNFYNKNRIYLDIRNEMNYSLDYFQNYGRNILLSHIDDDTEPDIADELDYYNANWPLCLLDLSLGSSGTTVLKVAFPQGDNSLPLLYVSQGKHRQNRIDRIKYGKQKFVEMQVDEESDYTTNSVIIQTPNYGGNYAQISSYVKVKYLKRFNADLEQPESEGSVLRAANKTDFIFPVLNMELPFKGGEDLQIKVYENDSYIDAQQDFGVDYIARTGIAKDPSHVILFAGLRDRRIKRAFSAKGKTLSIGSGGYETQEDFFERAISQEIMKTTLDADPVNPIDIYRFSKYVETLFFRTSGFIDYNRELELIVLSTSDYQLIIDSATNEFSGKYTIYLCVEDNTETENGYQKLSLHLTALQEENGTISVKSIPIIKESNPLCTYGFLPRSL